MSRQVREVNVIPLTKIKQEKLSEDEDEDTVSCKACSKTFVSETALQNHARIEHIDRYLLGEDLCVKQYVKTKRKYSVQEQEAMKRRTEELISSMEPTNLMSLASNDVSYIIIKSDGQPEIKRFKKEKIERDKPVRDMRQVKKDKEVQAISGPFECLQPSTRAPSGLCHQMFLSCCQYSAHWRDEHTRRRKGLRCQVCEKPLAHTLEPYVCQVCGIGFDNAKDLSFHSQTSHIKLKPFECTVCHKRFTQQAGVNQHMRMHTGDRPFTCSFCSKTFTQKSGLDQHLRIHTKIKPYRCVICSKAFCQSVHLQQHMRTHTNVAPFQCGICQKRFKQSSHLNYHLKYHNLNMTDEQKQRYEELMMMMGKPQVKADQVSYGLMNGVSDNQ
ncbi:zinc finger protein 135 [Danaus plexippus plexippus]|uniref:Zinc finger protein 135 n=1 Tax=Danaus plexippus plexippus TaxID=278856 RepID=A0A212F818_DANPL|nr:zinc finger protein 235-like [Danaus plexippus plexippus]OWR49887.1 zinc finger protein 135 [Danaus plexippus plexippus]